MKAPDFYIAIDVPYHGIKKNNRVIHGRGDKKWIGKSERLRSAENYLHLAFSSMRNKLKMTSPLKGDIHAIFRFYFADYATKDGKRSRKIPDLSNLICLPEDELEKAGIIENDTDIVSLDGSGRFPGHKNMLEIELRVLKDGVFERRSKQCPNCEYIFL